jgi:hemerythrin
MLLRKEDVQQVSNDVMNMLHEEEIGIINDFHDAVYDGTEPVLCYANA